jgi:hypothetical protein
LIKVSACLQVEQALLKRSAEVLDELLSCMKDGRDFLPAAAPSGTASQGKGPAKAEKGNKGKQAAAPDKAAAAATEANAGKVQTEPLLWKNSVTIDAHALVCSTLSQESTVHRICHARVTGCPSREVILDM